MRGIITRTIGLLAVFLFSLGLVQAATLSCEQISDSSLSIAQFSSKNVEIKCTASGGTVGNVQITPNAGTGLTISSSQTISSSISSGSSSSAKWSVRGDSPNTYTISYTVESDGTASWSGPSTTQVTVTSPAQLTVSYVSAPSEYTEGDTLAFQINNIGGAVANNVILKLYKDGSLVKSAEYPTTIAADSSASDSWSESDGYDEAGQYLTRAYIGSTLHDSATTTVGSGDSGAVCGNGVKESGEQCDGSDLNSATCVSRGYDRGTLSCKADCTFDTSSCSNDGGGGSSSSSSSSTTGAPMPGISAATKRLYFYSIEAGESKSEEMDKEGLPFTKLEFTAKGKMQNVRLTVKALSEAPEETGSLPARAYKYVHVEEENAENASQAKVRFRVEKAWLENNSVERSNIALFRYSDSWDEQPTEAVDEDDTYVYFESVLEGLSYFAIGEKEQPEEEVISTEPEPEPTEEQDEQAQEPDAPTGEVTKEDEDAKEPFIDRSGLIWGIIVLIFLGVLGVGGFFYWHEHKHDKVPPPPDRKEDKKEHF